MSNLQISLVVIGVFVVVVGVFLLWTNSRKAKSRRRRGFDSSITAGKLDPIDIDDGVTLGSVVTREEPSFASREKAQPLTPVKSPTVAKPIPEEVVIPKTTSSAAPVVPAPSNPAPESDVIGDFDEQGLPLVNAFLEEVARLHLRNPVAGQKVLEYMKLFDETSAVVPVRFFAWDDHQNRWLKPDPVGTFSKIAIYVQLAHRQGSLNDVMISRFYQTLQQVEVALDGESEFADADQVLSKAKKLDELVVCFGRQLSLSIHPIQPVSQDLFEEVASDLGFKRETGKRYEKVGQMLLNKQGRRRGNLTEGIVITWHDPQSIVLSLNVPLARLEEQPLKNLMRAANAFAAAFDAQLTDGAGVPITSAVLVEINKQLKSFYEQMETAGLQPGSETAHRLLA